MVRYGEIWFDLVNAEAPDASSSGRLSNRFPGKDRASLSNRKRCFLSFSSLSSHLQDFSLRGSEFMIFILVVVIFVVVIVIADAVVVIIDVIVGVVVESRRLHRRRRRR